MVTGLWGKKIGMTQLFLNEKVVPVTVIDTDNWFITQVKNNSKDGYTAIKVGCVRNRYINKSFEKEWLKNTKKYFVHLKEIKFTDSVDNFKIGNAANFSSILQEGAFVDVVGKTIGRGFAGAVKRHGFRGGSNSHGDKIGRKTGSLSFMRSRGRVIKGKRLPGRMGNERVTMKNLEVIKVDADSKVLVIKGSVPGKSGSLVFVSKT